MIIISGCNCETEVYVQSGTMDSSSFSFYEEISPINGKDYFNKSSSNIATVTVFYNEEGFTLEKTLSSLRLQQMPKEDVDHDLLLVGDGLKQMTPSMSDILEQIFDPIILPVRLQDWPCLANVCVHEGSKSRFGA